jgi:ABC-type transport system involved in multi-copper enzyme maturation permease subunit
VLGCAITLSDATFLVTMGAVYVALMASYPFAVAEKNDLDTLYATLPLSRRGFVAGRYLFAGLLFVVTELVMTALAVALGAATGRSVAGDAVTTMLAVCAAAYATVVAIQFPVFCRTGYTRARLVALLPFLALVPVGMLLDRLDLHWTLPAPPVTLLLAVGYGVLVLTASAAVSERLVARRLP